MISEQDSTNKRNHIPMVNDSKFKDSAITVDMGGEIRCPCNRLLMKGTLAKGSAFEIKCPKCREKYKFKII